MLNRMSKEKRTAAKSCGVTQMYADLGLVDVYFYAGLTKNTYEGEIIASGKS